jgi:hypothetical protein
MSISHHCCPGQIFHRKDARLAVGAGKGRKEEIKGEKHSFGEDSAFF